MGNPRLRLKMRKVVPAGGGATTLTTILLVNDTGTDIPAHTPTRTFFLPFKKAAIGQTIFPNFIVQSSGAHVPFSYASRVNWSDNSWMGAAFILRPPVVVPANSTVAIDVKDDGTSAGSTTGGSSADFSAGGASIQLEALGIENLSGTWVSSLTQGITDNNRTVDRGWAGAVVRKELRVIEGFRQASADHGQLETMYYALSLEDESGTLRNCRVMGRPVQPWTDNDTPAKLLRGAHFTLKNGATTIRALSGAAAEAKTFTVTVGAARPFNCTAHGYQRGTAVRLTTTGVLPAPFAAGTTYYVRDKATDNFKLYSAAGTAVIPTDAGTGVHTITPHLEIAHFASGFTAGSTAMPDVILNGTAASDAMTRVTFDKTYLVSTKVYPAFESLSGVASFPAYTYRPDTTGPLQQSGQLPESGDWASLTPEPRCAPPWGAVHFQTQAAVDEQNVRVGGLVQGHIATCLRRIGTSEIVVVNNGPDKAGASYSGMGVSNPTFRWRSSSTTSGFTIPADTRNSRVLAQKDNAHRLDLAFWAYLVTGEWWYLDLLHEDANPVSLSDVPHNRTISPDPEVYYKAAIADSQPRVGMNVIRQLMQCAAFTPVGSVRSYFTDLMNDNFRYANNFNVGQAAVWKDNGFWHFRNDAGSADDFKAWQFYVMCAFVSWGSMFTESSHVATFRDHLGKWYAMLARDFSMWEGSAYAIRMRSSNVSGSAIVSSVNDIFFMAGNFTYDTVDNTITYVADPTSVAPPAFTENDEFIYFTGMTSEVPGGLSALTRYYMVNVSGLTFQASLTPSPGHSVIDLTSAGSVSIGVRLQNPPAPTTGKFITTVYAKRMYAGVRFLKAAGTPGVDDAVNDVTTRLQASGLWPLTDDPNEAIRTGYP